MTHRIRFIIERYKHKGNEAFYAHEHEHEVTNKVSAELNLPYEKAANALMSAKGYSEYVKKHGYHFTDVLAEYASKQMKNSDKTSHSWSASTVKKTVESLGQQMPSNVTLGDITYAANMAYADFYPDLLRDEASCIKYALKTATDIDGYEGMIFCRWTADVIGKAVSIDWEKFV